MLSVHVPEPAETLILGNIACVTECRPQSLPYIEFLTKCHSIYPHIGLQQGNMYAHNGGQNRCEFALYVFWSYHFSNYSLGSVLKVYHVTSEILICLNMVWLGVKGRK